MAYSIEIINTICTDLGGTGGHAYEIDGLNEICTLIGATTGHKYNIDALNAICAAMGYSAGHKYNIDALNAIYVGGTYIYEDDAWQAIQIGSKLNLLAPLNLLSTPLSDNTIILNWDVVNNGVSVERSSDGITFAEIGTVAGNVSTYSDNTLNNYTQYFYRIRQIKNGIYSDYSNITTKVTSYASGLYDSNTMWYKTDEIAKLAKNSSNQTDKVYDFLNVGLPLVQNTIAWTPIWINRVGLKFTKALTNFMKTAAMTINQPTTIYMLIRQDSWEVGKYIFDGYANPNCMMTQNGVTPLLYAYGGTAYMHSEDSFPIGTFGIVKLVFNGVNSYMQVNGGAKVLTNAGTANMGGLSLGGNANSGSWSDFTIKDFIIKRIPADDTLDAKIHLMLNNKKAYDNFDYSSNSSFTSLWGKKLLVIGDSTSVTGSWQSKVGAAFNMTVTTHALGGLGILNVIDGGGSLSALTPAQLTGIDYVAVFLGLNDRGSLVGDITDAYPAKSTICAMYNYALDQIISRAETAGNTTLKIIPILPHNVGKYSFIDATGTDVYPAGSGQTLETVVNKLEQLSISRALKSINLFKLAGFNSNNWSFLTTCTPPAEGSTYQNNDNVHPSEIGYRVFSEEIIQFFKNNF